MFPENYIYHSPDQDGRSELQDGSVHVPDQAEPRWLEYPLGQGMNGNGPGTAGALKQRILQIGLSRTRRGREGECGSNEEGYPSRFKLPGEFSEDTNSREL